MGKKLVRYQGRAKWLGKHLKSSKCRSAWKSTCTCALPASKWQRHAESKKPRQQWRGFFVVLKINRSARRLLSHSFRLHDDRKALKLVRQRGPAAGKCSSERQIGALNFLDKLRVFCVPQHRPGIVRLKAFVPFRRGVIGPACLRATSHSFGSSFLFFLWDIG
jgi:hypothetical protein